MGVGQRVGHAQIFNEKEPLAVVWGDTRCTARRCPISLGRLLEFEEGHQWQQER